MEITIFKAKPHLVVYFETNPGKSLVGEPANETAYYVIQHSDKIEQYFPVVEKAGR